MRYNSEFYQETFSNQFIMYYQHLRPQFQSKDNYNYNINQYSKGKMGFKQRDDSSKRTYSRISIGKRKKLIQFVIVEGMALTKAIKKLNIKLTTARLIIQKYKQTGTFPMRKFKKIGKMNYGSDQFVRNISDSIENDSSEEVSQRQQSNQPPQEDKTVQYIPQIKEQCPFQYCYIYYYPFY